MSRYDHCPYHLRWLRWHHGSNVLRQLKYRNRKHKINTIKPPHLNTWQQKATLNALIRLTHVHQQPRNHQARLPESNITLTMTAPISPILKACITVTGIILSISSLLAQATTSPQDTDKIPIVEENPNRPNVIIIMTDDQGWGDFGVNGNKIIETPNLDKLANNSLTWENFYVSPVCSPTRASLMTGRYNQRTKCLDTYLGRSMMANDEVTIAEALQGAGYATGIFGKWHLGDNYPMRPSDQGFEHSLIHKGGGIGQPSEPIENNRNYTNPILFKNNSEIATKGYCTDIFFNEAIQFIASSMTSQRPFFAYIATNAPHGPFHDVPEKLLQHYKSKNLKSIMPEQDHDDPKKIDKLQRIAAMITNVDQNIGKLLYMLEINKLTENTIIIFLNDNGPNTNRYTGPFKGKKSNIHEGGIRSPLWIHWPAKIKHNKKINTNIAAHIDIMPTIMDACDLGVPEALAFDGRSLLKKLINPESKLPHRPIIIQAHRGAKLIRYHNFMVRDKQWKMSHNSGFQNTKLQKQKPFELFDLSKDPSETNNIAKENPEKIKQLTNIYNQWYDDVTSTRIRDKGTPYIIADKTHENPLTLTWQDRISKNWNMKRDGIWKLSFPTTSRADLIIYAPPNRLIKPEQLTGLTPTLQIGTTIYKGKPLSGNTTSLFQGITIPKGKHHIKAKFSTTDNTQNQDIHAYQIRIIHR